MKKIGLFGFVLALALSFSFSDFSEAEQRRTGQAQAKHAKRAKKGMKNGEHPRGEAGRMKMEQARKRMMEKRAKQTAALRKGSNRRISRNKHPEQRQDMNHGEAPAAE